MVQSLAPLTPSFVRVWGKKAPVMQYFQCILPFISPEFPFVRDDSAAPGPPATCPESFVLLSGKDRKDKDKEKST